MRPDSKGMPDICRETFSPVKPEAIEIIKMFKLTINSLIHLCRDQVDRNHDKEVRRLFAMAATDLESGCIWAVKGLTSEDWAPVPVQETGTDIGQQGQQGQLKK